MARAAAASVVVVRAEVAQVAEVAEARAEAVRVAEEAEVMVTARARAVLGEAGSEVEATEPSQCKRVAAATVTAAA